jgi:hypothetical protein
MAQCWPSGEYPRLDWRLCIVLVRQIVEGRSSFEPELFLTGARIQSNVTSRAMTRCECASEDSDFLVCPYCGRAYPKMDWLNILLSITFALALLCLTVLYRLER